MATLVKDGDEVLTVPTGDRLLYRDASHSYWVVNEGPVDIQPGDKLEATRLTSPSAVLKIINKPALVDAAVRLTREGLDYREEWGKAATRGTGVHEALRVYCADGTVPDLNDFDKEHHGYVAALCAWLIDARPEPLLTEFVVFHRELLYAGRADLLCRIDGKVHLADLKTGTGTVPYAENLLQLVGYQAAMESCGLEPLPDVLGVLKVCAEGRYRYVESPATVSLWGAAFELNRGMKDLEKFLKTVWDEEKVA